MLFRCEGCPHAYCEDHLPPEADVAEECLRFGALGWRRPATACFVRCAPRCARLVEALHAERGLGGGGQAHGGGSGGGGGS